MTTRMRLKSGDYKMEVREKDVNKRKTGEATEVVYPTERIIQVGFCPRAVRRGGLSAGTLNERYLSVVWCSVGPANTALSQVT
jgi:hypothetical protein